MGDAWPALVLTVIPVMEKFYRDTICKFISYLFKKNQTHTINQPYFTVCSGKTFFFSQGKQIANSVLINSVLSDIRPFLVFHSRSCWCKIQTCQLSCMRAVRQITTPALTELLLCQDWEPVCRKWSLSWCAYGKKATGSIWGLILLKHLSLVSTTADQVTLPLFFKRRRTKIC